MKKLFVKKVNGPKITEAPIPIQLIKEKKTVPKKEAETVVHKRFASESSSRKKNYRQFYNFEE